MSKSSSGHFSGTNGSKRDPAIQKLKTPEDVILERTKGLDLMPHPRKTKSMSASKMHTIRGKIKNRTATKTEYKEIQSENRFRRRRSKAFNDFWKDEASRIKHNLPTTRQWTPEQKRDIINNRRPKYKGKTIEGHHTYSASLYPHLANKSHVIFPATYEEHKNDWHGGNYKKSLPGQRIKKSKKRSIERYG